MKRIHLMGFDFSSGTFEEVLHEIRTEKFREDGYLPVMITPNADQVLQYNNQPEIKHNFDSSYFILPDGFPIIAFSKAVGKPLAGKLSGSDFFPLIWKTIITEQRSVFVIAPNETVGEMLTKEYPSVRYYVPGMLKDIETIKPEVYRAIAAMGTTTYDYVIIGLGFPKQEIFTTVMLDKLKTRLPKMPLFMLLGASFEFYLGLKKRAPKWISKIGFEWLHRLSQEPGRLWKRYTVGNFNFMVFFVKQYFKENTRR